LERASECKDETATDEASKEEEKVIGQQMGMANMY
jgi:hypothetical protein